MFDSLPRAQGRRPLLLIRAEVPAPSECDADAIGQFLAQHRHGVCQELCKGHGS